MFTCSCIQRTFNKRLANALSHVRSDEAEISSQHVLSPTYSITWSRALELLKERNPSILSAKQYTNSIKYDKENQWKTWLPRPTAFANLNSSLSQLSDLSFSDLNASLIAPLTIPNPYSEIAQAFEYSLSYLQSIDNYELTYRRQVTALYEIFSRMDRIKSESNNTNLDSANNITEGISLLNERSNDIEQVEAIQAQLVQMLNLPGLKPTPIANTRPSLNYESRLDSFVLGKNYGKIAMRLASYNIEAALLREKGVRLRKWPSLAINLATPALFDSRNSKQNPIDPENISLFGGLFKSYDFIGTDTENIKSAKENTEYVKTNLRLQLDSDIRDWKRLQSQYRKIQIAKKLAKERLKYLQTDISSNSAVAQLKIFRELTKDLHQLEESKQQIDLEIWTWDDNAWK